MAIKLFKKSEKDEAKKKAEEETRYFVGNPFLKSIKPKSGYIFHSDYFEADDGVMCILTYRHVNLGAHDRFSPFWGINRFPARMPKGVVTMNFEQVSRLSDGWIQQHQTKAEGVAETNDVEQNKHGTYSSRGASGKMKDDFKTIAMELNAGASYLNVHDRLVVKAPDVETLDEAIDILDRLYIDRFGTLSVAPFVGDQRRELGGLYADNADKRGRGEYFTSSEFAGAYHLVTHGFEDARGEYIGYMVGDVNNPAVLFDVNNYRHHIVVATEQINKARGRAHIADMWGAKIGQACLADGGRVVHLLLDSCDMSRLGPTFDAFTHVIDMNHGDVNMFEMFGDVDDELSIFPAQMQKLILMAEQAYETNDNDRSIIRSSLESILVQFYIEQGMWRENAEVNKDRLRVVGVPHDQVPLLKVFTSYLDMEYKAIVSQSARDDERVHALSVLSATFRNLLSNNGDIFNCLTSDTIDSVVGSRRVIYDFSKLLMRGTGVAMAQLVNVVGLALSQVKEGDTVIIHSAERITRDDNVRAYIETQFDRLYGRGARLALLYNSVEKMIDDVEFNHFDKADYTVLGNMSDNVAELYQKALGQRVPDALSQLVTDKSHAVMYIRRGFDNVVFQLDLKLDPDAATRRRV